MWSRAELKQNAKYVLRRSYWACFLVCLVITLICGDLSSGSSAASNAATANGVHAQISAGGYMVPYLHWNNINLLDNFSFRFLTGTMVVLIGLIALAISLSLNVFLFNPLRVGKDRYFIRNITEEATFSDVWSVFTGGNYLNIVKIMLVKDVKIFLWSLLLVIPGIVKRYEYQMIPYLLAENDGMSMEECFLSTKLLTNDQKGEIFVLDLSFMGWYILGSFLFGIGTLFVNPYKQATDTELYICLKEQRLAL